MKICFQPFVNSYSKYYFASSDENKSLKRNGEDNNFRNNSLILAGALCLAGIGIYIARRKPNVKNNGFKPQEFVNTQNVKPNIKKQPEAEIKIIKLPDEKIANSLPEELVSKLSVGDNYQNFKNFLSAPDDAKIAGVGANSIVYNMDFLDDYVLKVMKSKQKADPNKIPIGLFPDGVNLGQPVWEHPDNKSVLILKKVSGQPNSIKNWSDTIYDKNLNLPRAVTQERALEYFEKITKIADESVPVLSFALDASTGELRELDTRVKGHEVVIGDMETMRARADAIAAGFVDLNDERLEVTVEESADGSNVIFSYDIVINGYDTMDRCSVTLGKWNPDRVVVYSWMPGAFAMVESSLTIITWVAL